MPLGVGGIRSPIVIFLTLRLTKCASTQLLLEQRSFSHLSTYVFKAESALDGIGTSVHSSTTLGIGSSGAGAKKIDLHQAVEAKLALCTALSHLANGNYTKATHDFLQPMSAALLAPWTGTIVSVGDIAVYATLCALATLGRSELKARVIESEGLAGEGEGMKELLDAWMASNFRTVLGLLEKYSVSAPTSATRYRVFSPPLTEANEHPVLGPVRLVITLIPCSAHTFRVSRRKSARAQSSSISSRSRRFDSSA